MTVQGCSTNQRLTWSAKMRKTKEQKMPILDLNRGRITHHAHICAWPEVTFSVDWRFGFFSPKNVFFSQIFFAQKWCFWPHFFCWYQKYFLRKDDFFSAKFVLPKNFFGQKTFFSQKWFFSAKKHFSPKNDFFSAKNVFSAKKDFFQRKMFFQPKMIFSAKNYFFRHKFRHLFFQTKIFFNQPFASEKIFLPFIFSKFIFLALKKS